MSNGYFFKILQLIYWLTAYRRIAGRPIACEIGVFKVLMVDLLAYRIE